MANTVSRKLSDETLNRIIQIESAGNPNARARTSSAAGLGQFVTATWLATVQKHKPQLFKAASRDAVAALRVGIGTADLQIEMLARFTEDNAAALGYGLFDGDLYLAHFLGIADARKLFRAPALDLASKYVSEAAVKANPSILGSATCGHVRAWAQASMEQRWDKAGKPDWVKKYAGAAGVVPPPPDVPPVKQPVPSSAPPLTKKQTGVMAALSAAFVAVTAFVQAHPFVIGGGVFLIILAFIAWRLLRNKES